MKYKNQFRKMGRLILIIIAAFLLSGCSREVLDEQGNVQKEYVVNTRSGKIHSSTCYYVDRMSEQNKKVVQDTLLNLIHDGFIVCRRCRAGIAKSDRAERIDRLNYPNLYIEDIVETATTEKYYDSIEEMGEWYVNHVPTYATTIQQEQLNQYKGILTDFKNYNIKGKDYKVLTEDKAISTSEIGKDSLITRGKESAIQYLDKNYKAIKFKSKIAYYPCELLIESKDYNTPGDDCTRYVFAVLNLMDSKFTEKYKALTRTEFSKTNSEALATNEKDIAFGMINLGFKLYGSEGRFVDVNSDSIPEGYIFKIKDDFKLKEGDILARPGHVHIYLGDGERISAENFGWGRVYREFPAIYDIQVKNVNGNNVIALTNSANEDEYYTRVYRYIGNSEE